ncbi:DUF2851 family protein [Mangrovimonas sp. DI 80]|uniref:DUF2851 family protein n=1 Tax=Mangrovimonas sp. DI 80 TaxID=1779330 RepID=UPI000975FF39|nr:DUF2851 family protein [Mangrovimonas sp. DI 80]OMP31051.1 hypothetical protein BKM32_08240 [Mangrovimonas sp. DI 80]
MQEDFLHYLWKYKIHKTSNLKTTSGETVTLANVGQHNTDSGPDFFNAQIKIGNQLWAGNVEVHVKSSDWFVHGHEQDQAYDNVILHVVWEHDTEIFRKDNSEIPTLQLKDKVDTQLLDTYSELYSKGNKWIYCEDNLSKTDRFVLNNWLERLYIERLEQKYQTIEKLLSDSKNDWEAVLFKMLAKNFGLKVNGDAFFSLAQSVDFSVVRKLQSNQFGLEALFFGQCGWLDSELEDVYYLKLQKEYGFLKQKFQLSNVSVLAPQFFRLRPPNFPTIRLSQLASLYANEKQLFSKLMELNSLEDYHKVLDCETSLYWETHYSFGKSSKPSKKRLTKTFVDLLLINTIIPIKFAHCKANGKEIDNVVQLAQQIHAESNSLLSAFANLGIKCQNALQSQALIQLKRNYCERQKCLDCAIGANILQLV